MTSTSKTKDDANAMPPPPIPASNKPPDAKILQPEFEALAQSLKDVIVKTSQVYSFYSDARRLGIMQNIPNPPRKLTAALGRDIEKYDQLCDSIEAQLHRAITVLKRDLRREEEKKEEERRNAAKVANVQPIAKDTTQPSDTQITLSKSPTATLLGRRPSTVSISSLQRHQFPLKLDLSSASLRMTEEEATMFQKDLGSPVTLAPKSARPVDANEFPSDLMMAFSNTPLQSDLVHGPPTSDIDMDMDIANMTDLFGPADSEMSSKENVLEGFEIHADVDAELFGEFKPDTGLAQTDPMNTTTGASIPSRSLLAQFSTSDLEDSKASLSAHPLSSVSGEGFDMAAIDLSNLTPDFFAAGQNPEADFRVDMDFMGLDAGGVSKTE